MSQWPSVGRQIIPLSDFRKQAFLDWLTTPPREREHRTLDAFAEAIDVHANTLTAWKRDADFLAEWEKRYLSGIGSPERKQNIMDTLLRTATDQDDPKHVQAAKTYFEIEGSMRPQKMQVEVTRAVRDLSDAELAGLIAEKAEREQESRAS